MGYVYAICPWFMLAAGVLGAFIAVHSERNALALVIAILAPLAAMTAPVVLYRGSVAEATIAVTGKERTSGNAGVWLVFTDGEVLCVTDSISFWTFNASDRYGAIVIGKAYKVRVAGWRVPFFSMYRNILQVEEDSNG